MDYRHATVSLFDFHYDKSDERDFDQQSEDYITERLAKAGFDLDRPYERMFSFGDLRYRQEVPKTHMSGRGFLAAGILIGVMCMLLVAIAGCTSTEGAVPRVCTTCIGPYDITLTSHREAVFGKPGR